MANIVLVPGAYHGGWYYAAILPQLRDAGHVVHTITLSGLNGAHNRSWTAINLETHIDDLVSLIELEQLDDVILCGHSYGGMVIAGASDRLKGRVRTLLFLDALVPENGDSVWSMWAPGARDLFIQASFDGVVTQAPPGVDARARPHPLATFLQPIKLSAEAYDVKNKIYAWCQAQPDSPFESVYRRLANDSSWATHKLACGHDIMSEAPDLALTLILREATL
jgi:pimeloyl-ACP methyl ester carboxylesterase